MYRSNQCLKSLIGAALAVATGGASLYAQTQNPPPSAVNFGIIGMDGTQTLRLSVVALPDPSLVGTPQYGNPTCIAQLGFENSAGAPVGPSKFVNLNTGQGDFLDLAGHSLGLIGRRRAEVLPVVTVLTSAAGVASSCQPSAEIFDGATGFSLVLIQGPMVSPNEPVYPLQMFPLEGVAFAQILRLNVVGILPDPNISPAPVPGTCNAQMTFVDDLGNPVGPTPKVVSLLPGQATYLDVAGSSLVGQPGQRAELRAVVTTLAGPLLQPGASVTLCAATAEIYDKDTGRTSSIFPGGMLKAN